MQIEESSMEEHHDDSSASISSPKVEDNQVHERGSLDASVVGRSGRSFAERRASKYGNGFNVPTINTARFRTTSPFPSPGVRSPCLTIPPGISPTALLDSPIMLLNNQLLSSPTTGTFPMPRVSDESFLNSVTPENGNMSSNEWSSFQFKLHRDHNSLQKFASCGNQEADADYQALVSEQSLVDFEFRGDISEEVTAFNSAAINSSTNQNIFNMMMNQNNNCGELQMCHSNIANNQTSPPEESIQREDMETYHPVEVDQKGSYSTSGMQKTSEDGYNWRKYGQKQVKGSEYPRSYYKCTHPNCQVKKKVERSYDGQITEIIYKGTHNHEKAQSNHGASVASALSFEDMSDMGEGNGASVRSVWRNMKSGSMDWRAHSLERTSSASVLTELSGPFSTIQENSVSIFESEGTPGISSTHADQDDDDGGDTQGRKSAVDDADDEESESKRRRTESCLIETSLASRAGREPRVVVQIQSDIDILDDGYRWRKYGQKVVKGNPNPRSYYKCTSAGCSVRKHVERASNDLKCVITTYEGKHNHEVPAARNSSQLNLSSDNISTSANNAQPAVTFSRNNIPKPETQVQKLTNPFERKPEFSNGYMRCGLFEDFSNDIKFEPSSIYEMKIPSLQNTLSYCSYGLNPIYSATAYSIPDFPLPLPSSMNISASGYDFNHGRSIPPVQPFQAGREVEDGVRFLKPKQEKDDNIYDACMPMVDNKNPSSLPQVYHRSIGNLH